jgi:hypothetical protein
LNLSNQGTAVLGYNQSVMKNLTAGVEFAYNLGAGEVGLNATTRYHTPEGSLALSKKDTRLIATYVHKLEDIPGDQEKQIPATSSYLAFESNYNTANGKSELLAGLKHQRAAHSYHLAASSERFVQMSCEAPTGYPMLKVGLNAQVQYDGSGEAAYGMSITYG